jgi:hypothetical protein
MTPGTPILYGKYRGIIKYTHSFEVDVLLFNYRGFPQIIKRVKWDDVVEDKQVTLL